MRRLVCLLRGHSRVKGRARREGGHHYARCLRCDTMLFRDPDGHWRAARTPDLMPRTLDLRGPAADRPPTGPVADAPTDEAG